MFGAIIKRFRRRGRVSAHLYLTSAHRNDLQKVGLRDHYVSVRSVQMCTDRKGYFDANGDKSVEASLEGRHAKVIDRRRVHLGLAPIQYVGSPRFNWNKALKISKTSMEFRNLMAYYHTTEAHEAFCTLLTPQYLTSLDALQWLSGLHVLVNERQPSDVRRTACWDRIRTRILFGEDVSYALDSLVIYHEYAHAIVDMITRPCGEFFPSDRQAQTPQEREAAAISEAFADFLACSMKDTPVMFEGYHSLVRDLEQPHVFNATGNPYVDCQALSSALWQLRKAVGKSVVNRWIIEVVLHLRVCGGLWSLRFLDVRNMLLGVDEVENGQVSNHRHLIIRTCEDHGIH